MEYGKRLDSIIEAACAEFGEKGYSNASTACICKKAEVSKGLLFHYFKTKKGLYLHVVAKLAEEAKALVESVTFEDCNNHFEIIAKIAHTKLDYYVKNPHYNAVLLEAIYRSPKELREDIDSIITSFKADRDKYFEQLQNRFSIRDKVDPKKALDIINLLNWFVQSKIENELTDAYSNDEMADKLAKLNEQLLEYYEIVFNGISKQL